MRKRVRALNAIVSILLVGAAGFPQSKSPKATPLGTQNPQSVEASRKDPPVVLEDPDAVLGKAIQAHGGRQVLASVVDSVSTGKITFFTVQGLKSVADLTLVRKGSTLVQRIVKQPNGELRQGSNGRGNWESFNGMTTSSAGDLVGNFVESQTIRALNNLLDSQARGFTVRDGGSRNEARVLEAE